MFMRWGTPGVEDLPQQSARGPVSANLPHQHHDDHGQGGRKTDGECGDQTGHLLSRRRNGDEKGPGFDERQGDHDGVAEQMMPKARECMREKGGLAGWTNCPAS
jgi:hypothetical protein